MTWNLLIWFISLWTGNLEWLAHELWTWTVLIIINMIQWDWNRYLNSSCVCLSPAAIEMLLKTGTWDLPCSLLRAISFMGTLGQKLLVACIGMGWSFAVTGYASAAFGLNGHWWARDHPGLGHGTGCWWAWGHIQGWDVVLSSVIVVARESAITIKLCFAECHSGWYWCGSDWHCTGYWGHSDWTGWAGMCYEVTVSGIQSIINMTVAGGVWRVEVVNCCEMTMELLYCCSMGRGSWQRVGIWSGNTSLGYCTAWAVDGWKGSRGIVSLRGAALLRGTVSLRSQYAAQCPCW